VIAATAIAFAAAGTALAGQALWVANGANVVEFAQLPGGKHDEKPKVQLNSAVFGAPQGVVFDAANNLWVIDGGNGGTIAPSLDEFTEAQLMNLKKNPTPTPNVQITSGDLVFPQQAVFDASGNMWLSDNGTGKVFVITPAQLAAGGNIAFTNTIESDPMFNGPLGIVLHGGNLYIANNADTTIFEFNAGHLPAIGSGLHVLVPDVILSDDGMGSNQGPWALVFDQAGDLWSSNANSPNTLVKFGPTQISSTGAPTPQITINPSMKWSGAKRGSRLWSHPTESLSTKKATWWRSARQRPLVSRDMMRRSKRPEARSSRRPSWSAPRRLSTHRPATTSGRTSITSRDD
jgi:hypothetical protein